MTLASERGVDQTVAIAEASIDGGAADADTVGEIIDGPAGQTPCREEHDRGVEQFVVVAS